jgi:hypothetical protein
MGSETKSVLLLQSQISDRPNLIPRASMLDIPFSSRYQVEMKKELFIDGLPELLLLRLLAQNQMYENITSFW